MKGVERSDPTRQEDGIGPCASVSESERLLHGDMLKICNCKYATLHNFYLANTKLAIGKPWCACAYTITREHEQTMRCAKLAEWRGGAASRLSR